MTSTINRALEMFDTYAEMSPRRRARALHLLSEKDAALHQALSALLMGDASKQRTILDISPLSLLERQHENGSERPPDSSSARFGKKLGAWRISGLIAHGGFGSVYEAVRDDKQYQQRVALKCVNSDFVSAEALASFLNERNTLARLEHPGIVPILDGGVDEDGHPWFAMRYVDGAPIDAWCDRRKLPIPDRVDLLLQACDALTYLHAQGVLHQDIKPSNVLVTNEGLVQLIDFGISSVLTRHPLSGEGIAAATVGYSAPEIQEQTSRQATSDLYSLGVLAYRLLCDHWPTPAHAARTLIPLSTLVAPVPMHRLLSDADAHAAHMRGQPNAASLARVLAGDLSAIMLKAVATAPEDRYASVSDFSADLRRWRERLPISLRKGSLPYRAFKFVRRNAAAVTIASLMAAGLAAGLFLAWNQGNKATREKQANMLVNDVFSSTLGMATISSLGAETFSPRAMLETTEDKLRRLPLSNNPSSLARGLAALARSHAVLGDYRRADNLAKEASRLINPEDDKDGFVATTYISILNINGHHSQAADITTARLRQLDETGDNRGQLTRLTLRAELAKAKLGMGKPHEALQIMDDSVSEARKLPPGHEETLAELLISRARFLQLLLRHDRAEADAREAGALARSRNPVLADDALEVLILSMSHSHAHGTSDLARQLRSSREKTLGATHPKTAKAMVALSQAGIRHPDRKAALETLEILGSSYGEDSPDYAEALTALAWELGETLTESVEIARRALAIQQRTQGDDNIMTVDARVVLGGHLSRLQGEEYSPELASEGLRLLKQSIAYKDERGIPAPYARLYALTIVVRLGDMAALEYAEPWLRSGQLEANELRRVENDHTTALTTHYKLLASSIDYLRGDRAQADAGFAHIIEKNRAKLYATSSERQDTAFLLLPAYLYRALYAYETCNADRAEALLKEAFDLGQGATGVADTIKSYHDNLRDTGQMIDGTQSPWISSSEIAAINARAQACARGRPPSARGRYTALLPKQKRPACKRAFST